METEKIVMDRAEAAELYREYRKSRRYETKIDAEVKRTYRAIAQGQVVIRAIESLSVAGLGADTLPKLALTRADAPACELRMGTDGSASYYGVRPHKVYSRTEYKRLDHQASSSVILRAGSFRNRDFKEKREGVAIVPQPPLHLRPKAEDMSKYHILWEAEWAPIPPRDPMLLRRIGKADLWVVVAHWDLTEVERAALATRI